MKAISTQPFKVSKLFSDFEYVIPAFQRPYSWIDKDQCQTLWEDLTEFYDENQDSDSKWFLGSIVLYKNSYISSATKNEEVRYVVDGQQRLTTLFILLAVLKNKFGTYKGLQNILSPKDELTDNLKDYARIRSDVPEDAKDAEMLYRFASENDFVADGKQMNKFVRNFEFFREKVNRWIGAVDLREKNPRLYKEGFLKFILNRVELLCIECDDEEDAFRLFEVVNDRGMELSPVQVIKPSMMRGMNEDDKREFLEDWGRWTDAGESKEDNGPLVSFLFQVLKEIRSVKAKGNPDYQKTSLSKFFVKGELNNVQADINKLYAIHKWSMCVPDSELYVLKMILDQVQSKTYKTALFAFLYNVGKLNSKTGEFTLSAVNQKGAIKFCRDLVRFLYGLSLVGKTSRDDIRKPCYDQVKWVFDRKSDYKLVLAKDDLKKIEDRLNANFEEENCYQRGLGTGLMLLASYLYACKGKGRMDKLAALLRKGFEREHICPKKSGAAWVENWDKDVHEKLVNSIGNLIPLEKEINLRVQNNVFKLKRDGEDVHKTFRDQQKEAVRYRDSLSPEAREYLTKYDTWTPENVREFAKKKCNLILKFLKDD